MMILESDRLLFCSNPEYTPHANFGFVKKNLFERDGARFMSFGQAYANTKNLLYTTLNVRNYVLFGDPLLDLNIPVEKTNIISINGKSVSNSSKDTLKALSKIEIEGEVTNLANARLTDFNGDVSITLFDTYVFCAFSLIPRSMRISVKNFKICCAS